MNHFWTIMSAPFVECLILVGLHSYLGLHVLRRHVIFVDLSLAQIAALGTTVGILFGIYDTESPASFLFALAFTVLGAAIFALSRFRDERIPQEAFIGLVYAVTAAVAVLVVEKTKGVEHLVNIMHGRLLWVRWTEVTTAAVAYSILGAIHYIFRKQFLFISEHSDEAFEKGWNVRAWDFFFYVTFGFTISISVKVAGVLLVFVFLVAPAIIAPLLSKNIRTQLWIGWVTGVIVTTVGMGLSWWADMPTGPMVVSFYGAVLLLVALVLYVVRAERPGLALRNLGLGALVLLLGGGAFWVGGSLLARSSLANIETEVGFGDLGAATHGHFHGHGDEKAEHTGHDGHQHDHLHGDGAAPEASEVQAAASYRERFEQVEIPLEGLQVIEDALAKEPTTGRQLLYAFLADAQMPPFYRSMGRDLLQQWTGQDFGYDPESDDNAAPLTALEAWIAKQSEG